MPELPEVETVRLGLAKHLIGRRIKEIQVLHSRATSIKSIAPIGSLTGAKILDIRRRGKFMWFVLNRPEVLVAHLGMSGQFLIQPKKIEDERHLRVRIKLGRDELRFIDQRTFGWLSVESAHGGVPSSAAHIALDPFDSEFKINDAVLRIKNRKTQIKKAILDQTVLSGIGNIYADESLWLSKIHPEARTENLKVSKVEELLTNSRKVMVRALAQGGTSFDELYINVNGESGYFARSLEAYGREGEPCSRCGAGIRRIAFAGRSSHFCPKCQPKPKSKP